MKAIEKAKLALRKHLLENKEQAKLDLEKIRLLYKPKKEQNLIANIIFKDGSVFIDFWKDCGKFGTNEPLDGYILTPERLLQILQDRDDYSDDEI